MFGFLITLLTLALTIALPVPLNHEFRTRSPVSVTEKIDIPENPKIETKEDKSANDVEMGKVESQNTSSGQSMNVSQTAVDKSPNLIPTVPAPVPPPTVVDCIPRPGCLDSHPACLPLTPNQGWCPNPTPPPPAPSPTPPPPQMEPPVTISVPPPVGPPAIVPSPEPKQDLCDPRFEIHCQNLN